MSFCPLRKSSVLLAIAGPLALVSAGFLTGCGNMITTAPSMTPLSSGGSIAGSIHGGNQPVTGASVKLYAAGATGYGSVSTLYATTTSATDAYGSFSFIKAPTNTGVVAGGATSAYGCPVTGDPQMYVIAKGGNTQGATNGANSAAAFILALGTCSSISNSTVIDLNEVTTVATLAALQQYFNPVMESFGYANTAQSALGFANGVSTLSSLANPATGVATTSFAPASAVSGVTMAGVPETAKLNTIADILASCVNTTSSTSTPCTTLFTNATAPTSAAVTSQPAVTFTAATDTIQAGYYMLSNPTQNQSTTAMTNLFGLAAATAPFQPTVSTQPLDWTLSITYTPTGTCGSAGTSPYLSSAESIAVDANGNVWFNNGQATATGVLGKLSPTGAPQVCAFGTLTSGRGLTIDTAGNVWTAASNTTNSVYEYLANGTTLNWPTTTTANGIASDGSGNIFYIPGSSTPIQEYVGASTATATAAGVSVGGSIATQSNQLYLAPDSTGRLWAAATSGNTFYDLYPSTDTGNTGNFILSNVGTAITTSVINNAYGTAVDASGNIFSGNTCCSTTTPANEFVKITPSATVGTATGVNSGRYLGGLVAPRSTAIDGAGNVWAGMGYAVLNTLQNSVTANVFALAEVSNDFTYALSPDGLGRTGPATCASTPNCPTAGGFQKASLGTVRSLAIDPTGNVWAASNGTTQTIVEMVGAAVPVVTPLSTAAGTSKLGTKP